MLFLLWGCSLDKKSSDACPIEQALDITQPRTRYLGGPQEQASSGGQSMGSTEQGWVLGGIELRDYLGGFRDSLVPDCAGAALLPLSTLRPSDQVSCSWSGVCLKVRFVITRQDRGEDQGNATQKGRRFASAAVTEAVRDHLCSHFLLY